MRRSLLRVSHLLLTVLAVLCQPALGRPHVECADGTPCAQSLRTTDSAHSCCEPTDCHMPPVDKRCVLKAAAPLDSNVHRVASVSFEPFPVALLPVATIVEPPARVDTVPVVSAERPPHLLPKLGHGPRAPPPTV